MGFSKKSVSRRNQHRSWRDYQASLPKRYARNPRPRLSRCFVLGVLLALSLVCGLFGFIRSDGEQEGPVAAAPEVPTATAPEIPTAPAPKVEGPLDKDQVRQLLDERMFSHLTEKNLSVPAGGSILHIETTIDPDLQNYLLDTIDRKNSRHVGIVVMEALSGRVLALAGFDRIDAAGNPCLRSQFPAASIFKIVTAATAIDQCGYSADSPMQFSGSKHTLYKRQLTEKVGRQSTTIPLSEAFADSVNPVFGKLGELRLGKPLLEQAAIAFGFNQPLDFEVSLPPSHFQISDNPYNWAEVASGFNRQTTLSPLHGAALTAAVLNGGRMVTQTIVECISDDQGKILYRRSPTQGSRQIMSARAATALEQMMENTIASGTARKTFRGHQKDKVLAGLRIGGKTGSIGSSSQDVRYDWFVGFAREPRGQKQVVVAVMVGHEEFIGIRAGDYARRAMTHYFAAQASKAASSAASVAPSPPESGSTSARAL